MPTDANHVLAIIKDEIAYLEAVGILVNDASRGGEVFRYELFKSPNGLPRDHYLPTCLSPQMVSLETITCLPGLPLIHRCFATLAGIVSMASAETLGLTGDMVFAGPVLDKDQRHIDEGGGSVKMSSGTGQRLMADAKKSKELQPLLLAVSKVIAPIAAHLGVTEQKSVVLVNKTGPQPVGTQAFHTDTDAGVPGFIAILPFQEKTTMLVACGSRWAVHLAGSRQEKDGVTDEEIAAGIPKWTVARLVMEPGQLVLLDGNTVHAGDAGAPGQTSVRLHWYFMKEPLDNATYPITMLGKVFASLFK